MRYRVHVHSTHVPPFQTLTVGLGISPSQPLHMPRLSGAVSRVADFTAGTESHRPRNMAAILWRARPGSQGESVWRVALRHMGTVSWSRVSTVSLAVEPGFHRGAVLPLPL